VSGIDSIIRKSIMNQINLKDNKERAVDEQVEPLVKKMFRTEVIEKGIIPFKHQTSKGGFKLVKRGDPVNGTLIVPEVTLQSFLIFLYFVLFL